MSGASGAKFLDDQGNPYIPEVGKVYRANPHHLLIGGVELSGRASEPKPEDVATMREWLRQDGQKQPVRVTKDPQGHAIVTIGRHRTLGMQQLWDEFEAARKKGDSTPNPWKIEFLFTNHMNEEDRFREAVCENEGRIGLSPADYVYQIKIWRQKFKYSYGQIAKIYIGPNGEHRTESWVMQMEKLGALPTEVLDQVGDKPDQIPMSAARHLTSVAPEEIPAVLEEAKKSHEPGSKKNGRATETAVRNVLANRNGQGTSSVPVPLTMKQVRDWIGNKLADEELQEFLIKLNAFLLGQLSFSDYEGYIRSMIKVSKEMTK